MSKGKAVKREMVHNPAHYNQGKFETIDVIEDAGFGFNLGNCFKYLHRLPHKNDQPELQLQDIDKAVWYLMRERDRIAITLKMVPKFTSFLKPKTYIVTR